jgi:hypothetical protein
MSSPDWSVSGPPCKWGIETWRQCPILIGQCLSSVVGSSLISFDSQSKAGSGEAGQGPSVWVGLLCLWGCVWAQGFFLCLCLNFLCIKQNRFDSCRALFWHLIILSPFWVVPNCFKGLTSTMVQSSYLTCPLNAIRDTVNIRHKSTL